MFFIVIYQRTYAKSSRVNTGPIDSLMIKIKDDRVILLFSRAWYGLPSGQPVSMRINAFVFLPVLKSGIYGQKLIIKITFCWFFGLSLSQYGIIVYMFVFSLIWLIQRSVSAWIRIFSFRFLSVFTEWKESAVYQCMDPDFFYSVLSVFTEWKEPAVCLWDGTYFARICTKRENGYDNIFTELLLTGVLDRNRISSRYKNVFRVGGKHVQDS